MGGLDGAIDVGLRRLGDRGQDFAGGGIVNVKRPSVGCLRAGAIDNEGFNGFDHCGCSSKLQVTSYKFKVALRCSTNHSSQCVDGAVTRGRVETADAGAVRARRLWGPASRGPRRTSVHALGLASRGPQRPSQRGPAVGTRPRVAAPSTQTANWNQTPPRTARSVAP